MRECTVFQLLNKALSIAQISLVSRVFAHGPVDRGSILDRVIPKTFKLVLDTSLLNTEHYQVRIKGKVEQSRERSSALPYTSIVQLLQREPSDRPRLVTHFSFIEILNVFFFFF